MCTTTAPFSLNVLPQIRQLNRCSSSTRGTGACTGPSTRAIGDLLGLSGGAGAGAERFDGLADFGLAGLDGPAGTGAATAAGAEASQVHLHLHCLAG